VPLREFLKSLVHRGGYSQSEIARRAGVSQAVVNKILVGNSSREPAPATYKGICTAFSVEWEEFLLSHAESRENLRETYGWAIPARLTGQRSEDRHDQNPAVEGAAQQIGKVLDGLLGEVERRFRLVLESIAANGSLAQGLHEQVDRPDRDAPDPLGPQRG
jgi:transcriptional regulator with XRE-family HTH domain